MILPRIGYDAYSPPSAGEAQRVGYSFGMHYLGGSPDKDLTSAERIANLAAGIDIGLNWEVDTTDADGGFNRGVAYATEANRQADVDGAPGDVGIYYSVDTGRSPDQVRPYFQGIASIHRRPAGAYGGTEMVAMLDEGLIRWWWQANAGSWSGHQNSNFATHPRACLRQYVGGGLLPNIDHNQQLMADCGLWLSPTTTNPPIAPTPPHASEDDMNGLALSLTQPKEIETFRVNAKGELVHRYYFAGGPVGPAGSGWYREVLASGLMPSSAVIGPAIWPVDGYMHVYCVAADDSQVEMVWNPANGWTTVKQS